ncbi:MAG: hypothetical protein P3X22_001960 [Thermoprotei archaeon]|nr:hypothetical protein [Thermoprotei archaeon]
MVESLFELRWGRPAAVLSIAMTISKERGSSLEETLKLIAGRSAGWVKSTAETLLVDRGLREKIVEDISGGLKPPENLVREVKEELKFQ